MAHLTDYEFIRKTLPKHYSCSKIKGGVNCVSPNGITEDGDTWETMVMQPLRNHFGDRFQEVFHVVNTNHHNFNVYFKSDPIQDLLIN